MGWWTQNEEGASFTHVEGWEAPEEGESHPGEMWWGDGPADTLDQAIDEICKAFVAVLDRKPTKAEMRAGLEFSLGGGEEVGG